MPWFGWMSERVQKLIDCALIDEQFRAELLKNRTVVYDRFNLTARDIEVLEKNLFDEAETEDDFYQKLGLFGGLDRKIDHAKKVV